MAAPLDVLGVDGMSRVGRRRSWSKNSGLGFTEIFEGPVDKAKIFYESFINGPDLDEVTFSQVKGKGVVELFQSDNDPEAAISTTGIDNEFWQIQPQDLWKSVRAHQTFNINALQDDLEAARLFYETAGAEGTKPTAGAPKTYFDLLLRGVEEYARSVPVLQQTIRVSKRTTIEASWDGVDRAHVIGAAPGPTPPTSILGVINNMPEADDTKKQWLKRAPQVMEESDARFQIITHWWFARRWSETLYEGDVENGNP